jgi:hypothetical protein
MNAVRRLALITPLLCAAAALTTLSPHTAAAAEPATPGTITTETRSVPEFQAIALGGSMDLAAGNRGRKRQERPHADGALEARSR